MKNYQYFTIFLLKKNHLFSKKNRKIFGKKLEKMIIFLGDKSVINPASG